jgi:hemoglobin-like flavoprotein
MMTQDEIQSIRKSFRLLEGKIELVTMLFFNRLFRLDPSLRVLSDDLTEQRKMLMDAMLALNASLDCFPTVRPTLQVIGKRCAKCGVFPGDYHTVATALLQTLEEFAGPRFDRVLHRAWTKLLGLVSGEMLRGATAAEAVSARTGVAVL